MKLIKTLIIGGSIALVVAAVAIPVTIVSVNSAFERQKAEQIRVLNEVYDLYQNDLGDGVVSEDSYLHVADTIDTTKEISFETILSKSEVYIKKDTEEIVPLYYFSNGEWKHNDNYVIDDNSPLNRVIRYTTKPGKMIVGDIEVETPPQTKYTYLQYNGYRVYAS